MTRAEITLSMFCSMMGKRYAAYMRGDGDEHGTKREGIIKVWNTAMDMLEQSHNLAHDAVIRVKRVDCDSIHVTEMGYECWDVTLTTSETTGTITSLTVPMYSVS